MSIQNQVEVLDDEISGRVQHQVAELVEDKVWYCSGGKVLVPVGIRIWSRARDKVFEGVNG